MLVRLVYRHGLWASEAVGLRWSQIDLEAGVIHIARVKGSQDSTHTMDRDELRDLRKLRQQVSGLSGCETSLAFSAIRRALVMSQGPACPDGLSLASVGLAVSRSATTWSGVLASSTR